MVSLPRRTTANSSRYMHSMVPAKVIQLWRWAGVFAVHLVGECVELGHGDDLAQALGVHRGVGLDDAGKRLAVLFTLLRAGALADLRVDLALQGGRKSFVDGKACRSGPASCCTARGRRGARSSGRRSSCPGRVSPAGWSRAARSSCAQVLGAQQRLHVRRTKLSTYTAVTPADAMHDAFLHLLARSCGRSKAFPPAGWEN
jgi:hypothetical protein